MGPYGSKIFKTLLLPQITLEYFETSPEFSSQRTSRKYCFWIFDTLSFRFLTIFFFENFKFTMIVAHVEVKKPQLSGKRAIIEQNGVKFRTRR